jgi:hypothetical protein
MPRTGANRNGKATTIGRRLTPAGLELLPEEVRRHVENALAGGGREAWVIAPDEGGVYVEIRNART